jgi:hypothetical protein
VTQELTSFAHPGAWNENDVLLAGVNTLNEPGSGTPTGNPATASLSDQKARAQFSLWSMQASPLITDNNLTAMSPATRNTLLNPEVIAIDQDPLAAPSRIVMRYRSNLELSLRRLSDGDWALLAFNSAPRIIREGLLFPYLGGADFTRRFFEARKPEELLTDLPISTGSSATASLCSAMRSRASSAKSWPSIRPVITGSSSATLTTCTSHRSRTRWSSSPGVSAR